MEENIFEKIKKINEYGQEFWRARDIMPHLGYVRWENFEVAISRAKTSCENSGQFVEDHFRDATKMIKIAAQTEAKLRRENINRENEANYTHYDVGKKVRQTIKDIGGTMPENLPAPKSIKKSKKRIKKANNK